MSTSCPGVEVPIGRDGEADVFSMPDLQKRQHFVYQLRSEHVVLAVIRYRLRLQFNHPKRLRGFFNARFPEFSSYTVEQLQLDVLQQDKSIFPKEVIEYINDDKTYYPDFDTSKYVNMCLNYAGASPLTRKHFAKIISMTSYMIQKLLWDPGNPKPLVGSIMDACIGFFNSQKEYVEHLNSYPWHTWYNPLSTFQVQNDEVVKTVVRSRLSQIYNLQFINLSSFGRSYRSLAYLFVQDLPEYTNYQIRCILDELEDYDCYKVKTYDADLLSWLVKWIPNETNIAEYVINTDKIYMVDQGLEGILKVFHFTCHIIEHLFGQGYHRELCDVIKAFLTLLDDDKWPYKEILRNMPWHMWYEQLLPYPNHMVSQKSSYDLLKYMYPFLHDKKKQQADKKFHPNTAYDAETCKEYDATNKNLQHTVYDPQASQQYNPTGQYADIDQTDQLYVPTQQSMHQYLIDPLTEIQHDPTQQYSYQHNKNQLYDPTQQPMGQYVYPHHTGQLIQQHVYDPITGQHYNLTQKPIHNYYPQEDQTHDPTQQLTYQYFDGTQTFQKYFQIGNSSHQYFYPHQTGHQIDPEQQTSQQSSFPTAAQWQQTAHGQQMIPAFTDQPSTVQQCTLLQQIAPYNIDPITGELVAAGYQAVRGPHTGPLYMNINTGQMIGANRRLVLQTQQQLPSGGNVGLQKQLLAAIQQQQLDTYQLLPVEKQQQKTQHNELCD